MSTWLFRRVCGLTLCVVVLAAERVHVSSQRPVPVFEQSKSKPKPERFQHDPKEKLLLGLESSSAVERLTAAITLVKDYPGSVAQAALPELIDVIENDRDPLNRSLAAAGLQRLGVWAGPALESLSAAATHDASKAVRAAAARAAAAIRAARDSKPSDSKFH